MNNETTSQMTVNQMKALRNFDVPEATIQTLSKREASELLTELISRTEKRPVKQSPEGKNDKWNPVEQVQENLSDATRIVMDQFNIKDKSNLSEVHVAMIQEMSRQVYGIKYWVGKPNIRFD